MSALRTFRRRLLRGALYVLLGWVVFSAGSVAAMRWIDPVTSAFMLRARAVALTGGDRHFKFKRQWADYEAIASPMKLAVVASEDQKFPVHWGFDLDSINNAMEQRERGRVRGASTISQQVAKNLYLWPGQSWIRKAIEAYFTVLIEALWPKRRILEIYLNIAEFGVGTYGAEAASQKFFGKHAAQLNRREAALLAAVLPNPKRFRADKPSAYVRARQAWILGQMKRLGGGYLADLQ